MVDLFTHIIICHRTTNVVNIAQYCAILRNIDDVDMHSYLYLAMEKDSWIASIALNTRLILAAALLLLWRLRRNKRRVWIREILCKQRQEGAHHLLIPQLMSNEQHNKKFFKLSRQDYGYKFIEQSVSNNRSKRQQPQTT